LHLVGRHLQFYALRTLRRWTKSRGHLVQNYQREMWIQRNMSTNLQCWHITEAEVKWNRTWGIYRFRWSI